MPFPTVGNNAPCPSMPCPYSLVRLLAVELEDFSVLHIPFQMVVDMNRTAARRAARIEDVACLEGEIPADMTDDFVYFIQPRRVRRQSIAERFVISLFDTFVILC